MKKCNVPVCPIDKEVVIWYNRAHEAPWESEQRWRG